MKATLEFDLDNPDDKLRHLRCVRSDDMAIALFDLWFNLAKRVEKDGDVEPGEYSVYIEINKIMEENNITEELLQ